MKHTTEAEDAKTKVPISQGTFPIKALTILHVPSSYHNHHCISTDDGKRQCRPCGSGKVDVILSMEVDLKVGIQRTKYGIMLKELSIGQSIRYTGVGCHGGRISCEKIVEKLGCHVVI